MAKREHRELCEGHIDCPRCGPDSCGRPVVWAPGGVPHTVLCLGCFQTYGVVADPDPGPATPRAKAE